MLYRIQSTALGQSGNSLVILPNALITVRDKTGALARIYADPGEVTELSNPTTADASGGYDFYVAYGDYYDVSVTLNGKTVDERVYTFSLSRLNEAELSASSDASQTALDRIATAADRVQTGLDAASIGSDAAQTALDRVATAADRVQTGTDAVSAETARDAAFVNADVYADTAAGLAATTVGDQFQVASGDEIIRYSHDSGPVATEVARYPSAVAIAELRTPLAVGIGSAELVFAAITQNGATYDAATLTLTIPSGQTGVNSYILSRWILNGGSVAPAAWTGRRLRIRFAYDLSSPYTRTWGAPTFQVRAGGSNVTRTPDATKITDLTNRRIYEWDYTIQGDETEIRPYVRVTGTAAASDETQTFGAYDVYVLSSGNADETAAELIADLRDAQVLADAAANAEDQFLLRLKDVLGTSDLIYIPNAQNGATYDAATRTVTIPSGSTGENTTTLSRYILNDGAVIGAAYAGRAMKIRIAFEQSATFTRTWTAPQFQVRVGASVGGTNTPRTATERITVDGDRRIYEFTYTLQGDESEIRPFWDIDAGAATVTDETFQLVAYVPYIVGSEDADTTPADVTFNERTKDYLAAPRILRYATDLKGSVYDETITVATSGGDYTDPIAAIAAANAIEGRSPNNRVLIDVGPGTFDVTEEMQPGDYVDLIGRGAWQSIIRFFRDDSASGVDIDTDSTLRMQFNHRVEGLGIYGQNVRYAVHPEIPLAGSAPDTIWEIINCDIRHFGNPSPNNIRAGSSQNAIGSGTNSGQVFRVIGNYCWAELGIAFATHNLNGAAGERTLIEVGNNTFIGGSASGRAISIAALGTGRADRLVYYGNTLGGSVDIGGTADVRELDVSGYGNSPHVVNVTGSTWRPRISDEEIIARNSTGASIPAGSVLAFDGASDVIRLMTSADAATLFAGVAIEAIPDEYMGRVKARGWLPIADVSRSDSGALTFNATMSVGATAGKVASGGSQGLLRAVSTSAAIVG